MSDAKLVNIARLTTTYNLEIKQLPEDLKCAQCKLVLKDACHGPCCCRFCRVCIDDMITKGGEICPGDSEDCGESLLTFFSTNHVANKGVSKLAVRCPHDGCVHECQLANIEQHLRECPRKIEECPFRELGCTQDKLAAEEMGGHLQQENRRHSEILIEMISNINREIEILKRKDEASNREIKMLKQELVQKDEQIKSIMDQMINVQDDLKSIKEEKEDLAGQVRILTEEIEREIAERRENDELDSVRVIEHVDTEIAAVRSDIGSIKGEICTVKSQVQSVQALVGLGQVDVSFVWLIDVAVDKTGWWWGKRESEYFTGGVYPYKYRLESGNCYIGTARAALCIRLLIHAGPNDGQLTWPFEARVVITVTDRDRREACRSISRQCRVERPPENHYGGSYGFEFLHSELRGAGLNLSRGLRVSCVIVPGAD